MENPIAIANFFIEKSLRETKEITPMKLVKLAYLSHGWHLGIYGQSLINEDIQAWKYGPVIPSLYHEFNKYGNRKIENIEVDEYLQIPKLTTGITEFLEKIWVVYGNYSAIELSALTHEIGSPWYIVWEEKGGKNVHGTVIPNEIIEYYYKQKAKTA